jgi:hypothetical protein
MGMAEGNLWDHLLYDVKEILLGSLTYFPSRQSGSRMSDTEEAKALLDFRVPNDRIETSGEIHDLFQITGTDTEDFSHVSFASSSCIAKHVPLWPMRPTILMTSSKRPLAGKVQSHICQNDSSDGEKRRHPPMIRCW